MQSSVILSLHSREYRDVHTTKICLYYFRVSRINEDSCRQLVSIPTR